MPAEENSRYLESVKQEWENLIAEEINLRANENTYDVSGLQGNIQSKFENIDPDLSLEEIQQSFPYPADLYSFEEITTYQSIFQNKTAKLIFPNNSWPIFPALIIRAINHSFPESLTLLEIDLKDTLPNVPDNTGARQTDHKGLSMIIAQLISCEINAVISFDNEFEDNRDLINYKQTRARTPEALEDRLISYEFLLSIAEKLRDLSLSEENNLSSILDNQALEMLKLIPLFDYVQPYHLVIKLIVENYNSAFKSLLNSAISSYMIVSSYFAQNYSQGNSPNLLHGLINLLDVITKCDVILDSDQDKDKVEANGHTIVNCYPLYSDNPSELTVGRCFLEKLKPAEINDTLAKKLAEKIGALRTRGKQSYFDFANKLDAVLASHFNQASNIVGKSNLFQEAKKAPANKFLQECANLAKSGSTYT